MGSGGGGTSTQYVKSESSNLPGYVQPYFTGLLNRASAQLTTPYQTYGQERIAGFTPEQQQVQQNVAGMQTPEQIGMGSQLAGAAGLGSLAAAQYNPTQFDVSAVQAQPLNYFQMASPRAVNPMMQKTPMMRGAQTGYNPQLTQYKMGAVRDVGAQGVNAPTMEGARTDYGSQGLAQLSMQGPDSFNQQGTAQQYMSPYIQNALDVQKNEAIRDAKKSQLVEDLGAARQGTYGGSRQLLAGMERERNLGTQLGNIEAAGMQSAFQNAQQQFNTEQAATQQARQQNLQAGLQTQQLGTQTGLQAALANLSNEQQAAVNNQALQFQAQGMNADNALKAALANQQMNYNVGSQNLQATLGVQGLGAQYGTQMALANLSNAQQAQVQNQAAVLQQQGLNQQQALQAALANQQMGYNVGQQNLNAALGVQQLGAQTGLQAALANQQQGLEAQRLGEQSRQFGANLGLQGLAQAGQMGQTLGNLGQYQQQADLSRLGFQSQTAAQQQALNQQYLDTAYQDFLRQQNYPTEQLAQYSSILHGIPVTPSTTTTMSAPAPSVASQLLGTGLGALGMYKTLGG